MIYDPFPEFKRCTKCGADCPAAPSHFHRSESDGQHRITSRCKSCARRESAKYRAEHMDKWRSNSAKFREKNPEYGRDWGKKNPDRKRLSKQKRRARERKLPDTLTINDWQRCLEYWGGCCAICGRPPGLWHTIAADHWIPISDPNCPGTVPTNILPLCHQKDGCNNRKADKYPVKWVIDELGVRKARQIIAQIEDYFDWMRSNRE